MNTQNLTKWLSANSIISASTGLLIFLIGLGSFALSYSSLHQTALAYGINDSLAYIWPLLIDFALIVFSLAVVRASLYQERTLWPWLMVALYTVATIAFNILHAPDELAARVVAVVAPVTLFLSFETLMAMLKNGVKRSGAAQSLAGLDEQMAQKKRELTDFEAQRLAEIETRGQEAMASWNSEIAKLNADAEAKQVELANLTGQFEAKKGQLQEEVETLKRTIQTYQQDIEAHKGEAKAAQAKVYLPANLSIDQRRQLVQQMLDDRLTNEQIAANLNASLGTIKNDRKAIKEVNLNGHGG